MSDQKPAAPSDRPSASTHSKHGEFLHRIVLAGGVALAFLLVLAGIWYSAEAILLIFACILFAILLYELSQLAHRRLHLKTKFSLPLVVLVILGIIGGGGADGAADF